MASFRLSSSDDIGPEGAARPDEIKAELERILASPDFSASPRRRKMLRYLVEESMAGRGDQLKGYTVAVSALGRDENFNPQSDPIVRIEARRLRTDIDRYYRSAGRDNPLRLSIPKGGYEPFAEKQLLKTPAIDQSDPKPADDHPTISSLTFQNAVTRTFDASHRRLVFSATAAVMIAALAILVLWLYRPSTNFDQATAMAPGLIVLPFEALSTRADDRFLAVGVTEEITTNLSRFADIRIYLMPSTFRQETDDPVDLGSRIGVSYVVRGSVRSDASAVRVNAQLIETGSGQVLWSETYNRPLTPGDLLEVQQDISAGIASELGQPYGIIRNEVTARMLANAAPSMSSYACVLRGYAYRRSFKADLYDPVLACLTAAVKREPDYAEALAMLAWMHIDAGRFGRVPDSDIQKAYGQALDAASRAVAVDPTNVLALKALASTYHYLKNYEESERIQRKALELNPNDPDTLAQLGWRLAVRGRFDEGIPHLERAIARTVNPPGWYFHLIAVHLYLQGKYAEMLAAAKRAAIDDSGISWSFIAIAQGQLGNMAAANQALAKMAERSLQLSRDPAAAYRTHQAVDEIVIPLVEGLRKAGWKEPTADSQ